MVAALIKQRVAAGRAGADSYFASDYFLSDAVAEAEAEKPAKNAAERAKQLTVRLASARLIYNGCFHGSSGRRQDYVAAARWSRLQLDAELTTTNDKSTTIDAAREYLERAKALQAGWEKISGAELASRERVLFSYYVADAELLVLRTTGEDSVKQKKRALERTSLAKELYEKSWEIFQAGGHVAAEELFQSSSRWQECLQDAATTPEARQAACDAHLARMQVVRLEVARWLAAGRVTARDDLATKYYAADAEVQCLDERRR
jgi:hypothetical protein